MIAITNTRNFAFFPSRMAWVRLNRILAWALIASPIFQLAVHARLELGLLADLTLVLLHGALSLVLFGVPKAKGHGFIFRMHVLGFRPAGLSARNRFLLSGYRIALAMTPSVTVIPGVGWIALFVALYPVLRMPVSVLQHIYSGTTYALQRWGMTNWPAEPVVILYVILSIVNVGFELFGGAR